MEKLNDYFAMPVISIEEGLNLGYILNLVFNIDLKQHVGFVVADEESERENFLSADNVKCKSENCVMVVDKYALNLNFSGESFNPIGKNVYDKKGVCLGKVKDVLCNNGKTEKLITTFCEIPVKDVYSAGKDCIIIGKGKKKARPSYFETPILPKEDLPLVKAMQIGAKAQATRSVAIVPAKVTSSPSMLLGKIATMDILGFNNELIIRKGDTVTQNKIDKAKKHGKINLLIFNSK